MADRRDVAFANENNKSNIPREFHTYWRENTSDRERGCVSTRLSDGSVVFEVIDPDGNRRHYHLAVRRNLPSGRTFKLVFVEKLEASTGEISHKTVWETNWIQKEEVLRWTTWMSEHSEDLVKRLRPILSSRLRLATHGVLLEEGLVPMPARIEDFAPVTRGRRVTVNEDTTRSLIRELLEGKPSLLVDPVSFDKDDVMSRCAFGIGMDRHELLKLLKDLFGGEVTCLHVLHGEGKPNWVLDAVMDGVSWLLTQMESLGEGQVCFVLDPDLSVAAMSEYVRWVLEGGVEAFSDSERKEFFRRIRSLLDQNGLTTLKGSTIFGFDLAAFLGLDQ